MGLSAQRRAHVGERQELRPALTVLGWLGPAYELVTEAVAAAGVMLTG